MIDIIVNGMFVQSNKFPKYLTSRTDYDRVIKAVVRKETDFSKIQLPEDNQEKVLVNVLCDMNIYTTKLEDILTVNKRKLGHVYIVIAPYFVTKAGERYITQIEKDEIVSKLKTGEEAGLAWLDLMAIRNFIGKLDRVALVLTRLQQIAYISDKLEDLDICDSYFVKSCYGIAESMPEKLDIKDTYPFFIGFNPWREVNELNLELSMYYNFIKEKTKKNVYLEYEDMYLMY